jgi:guanylate kinase
MNKGKLLIISGFSGVGKGTVIKYLLKEYKNYVVSVSATTRQPRENEIAGIDYHYMTNQQFEDMIQKNQLLEYADYVDHYYGTPREFVENNINEGNNVILEIETKGALQVKKSNPEAVLIFILPPDADTLKKRLMQRQTESEEVIIKRLQKAAEETESVDYYEYFVINDEIDKCAENINKIAAEAEPELPSMEQVQKIKEDILKFSKGE